MMAVERTRDAEMALLTPDICPCCGHNLILSSRGDNITGSEIVYLNECSNPVCNYAEIKRVFEVEVA